MGQKISYLDAERRKRRKEYKKSVWLARYVNIRSYVPFSNEEVGTFFGESMEKIQKTFLRTLRLIGFMFLVVGICAPNKLDQKLGFSLGVVFLCLGILGSLAVALGELSAEWRWRRREGINTYWNE